MWIYPALVAIGLLVCFSVSRRSSGAVRIAFVLASICACGLTAFLLIAEKPVLMGRTETPWFQNSPWRELLSFAAMVLGMAAKYVWDLTEIRRARNAKLAPGQAKYDLEFDAWDFLQPLLVSGIVFSGVLALQKEINVSSLLFSFQNGFFWQTILKAKGEKLPTVREVQ